MENKRSFRYLTIQEHENGLQISLNEEGIELVKELKEDGKSDSEIWYELFEDVSGNSEYIFHDDMGESGFGLTDAEGITDGYFVSDNGDGYETSYPEFAKVYWFPSYMITSPLDKMFEEGNVFFTKADESDIVEPKKDFATVYNEVVEYIMADQNVDRDKAIEIINEENKETWIRDMVESEGETNSSYIAEQILNSDEGKYSNGGKVNNNEFTYMMLGRLKSDNDYFLGYGNRNEGSIWGNSVDSHIAEMKKLWNTLPEDGKPEWLSMEDILEYEKEMKKQYPEVGDKVIITTDSLGEKYKGMSGTINDRKLINDKYSIKLEDGMEMAFSKDEFRHNSINPRYENGGTVTKEEIDDFVYEYLTSREEAEETLKRRKARLSNEENQRLYELNKKSLNNELTNSEEIEFDKLVHKYRGWEYSKGGGIYSSDDRWVVTFQNQDSGKFEKVTVRANNKKNAIVIAEDESGLGSDWQYYSAEKEMANGGGIDDETIIRNKNKNDWKSKFDFYLKYNNSNIGKGSLMDMAYDDTKGVDSAIPQSLVGDVDNTAFFVYDYKNNFDGELVDLREKLKFSNTKVNVTIVVNGEVLHRDKLPDELLNPTFHQALDYVFKHDEVEAFDIRPKKSKYENGGGVNTGRSWHLDRQKRNKSESWEKPMSQRKKRYDNGGGVGEPKTVAKAFKVWEYYDNHPTYGNAIKTELKEKFHSEKEAIEKANEFPNAKVVAPIWKGMSKVHYEVYNTKGGYNENQIAKINEMLRHNYANGGGVDKRDSWHSDRRQFNKNESWEKPMSQRKKRYDNGGGVAKELNGYRVRIYKSGNDTSSQNVVSSKFDNIILVTDGIKGDSFSVMSNEPYIKLVKRNLFGKEVLSAEPVNFGVDNNHKMFGGTFVWSSDSRFRDDISKQPIPLHDRVEVYENGGVFVSPHVNDLHNYIIESYGFLLPKEGESGYDNFTYSDFAEELKSTYDIKNPRNKQVYDYLIHLGNIPMFSGKVSDMKKIEERMSTANIKFDNGGINDNITNKAKHEIDFLTKKGYDIDAYSTLNRDVIFGGEKIDDFIIATQGSIGKGKDTKFAIAYWYRDNEDGEMQISRNLLDEISDLFQGNPVILYTNAGVDLHSITEGKHKNIQVIKVAYGEFSGNSDEYSKGGTVESLEKELRKLQRDLNSHRLSTYTEGDESEEQKALNKEREVKLARFHEVLGLLREKDTKYSKGGGINSGRDLLFKSNEPHEQKYNRKREFKKYGTNGNWFNDFFENGGDIVNDNALMVINDNKQIKHHAEELNQVVDFNTKVPAWVVSKVHRSASDLSDATHYLEGVNSKFKDGGDVGYGSIKKEKQRMTDELFKKCGVFFAFSNEQFAKNKTPLKEGEKYISIGAGGYMPKGNYDAFVEGMKEIKKFGKKKVEENNLAETEILYELNNHESFYTGDYSDVVDMFKGTYTEEQIRNVYNKHIGSEFEQGGNVKYSVTAYLGEVISINTAEMALGRKINSWKDDIITIDGINYQKVFLKPEYKQIK